MAKQRSFQDDGSTPAPDPEGVMGRMYPYKTGGYVRELRFPACQSIEILLPGCRQAFNPYGPLFAKIDGVEHKFKTLYRKQGWATNREHPVLVGVLHEKLSVTADGQVLLAGEREFQIKREASRAALWFEGTRVWTTRPTWRDSEHEDGTRAFIWMESPETWEPDLPWLLFAALIWQRMPRQDVMPIDKHLFMSE